MHDTILTTTNDVARLITCAFNSLAALNDNSLAMIERVVPEIITTDIMIDCYVGELLYSPTDYYNDKFLFVNSLIAAFKSTISSSLSHSLCLLMDKYVACVHPVSSYESLVCSTIILLSSR